MFFRDGKRVAACHEKTTKHVAGVSACHEKTSLLFRVDKFQNCSQSSIIKLACDDFHNL